MQEMEIALEMREWGNVYRLVGCLIVILTSQTGTPSIAHTRSCPFLIIICASNSNSTSFEDLMLLRKPVTEQIDGSRVVNVKNGEIPLVYLVPSLSFALNP